MELDEAIRHCLERANQDCSECAKEHQQLAGWLMELKCRRANMSVDDMDEFTVQYAYEYGEWQYKEGYEAGKKDAVKHGHWVLIEPKNRFARATFKCSLCGQVMHRKSRFCPECGAAMVEDCDAKV